MLPKGKTMIRVIIKRYGKFFKYYSCYKLFSDPSRLPQKCCSSYYCTCRLQIIHRPFKDTANAAALITVVTNYSATLQEYRMCCSSFTVFSQMPRDKFEFFPGRHVLQPDEVAMADKLYGCVGVRDVGLVLVPLLDPEVVVLVLVSVHSHLHTHTR